VSVLPGLASPQQPQHTIRRRLTNWRWRNYADTCRVRVDLGWEPFAVGKFVIDESLSTRRATGPEDAIGLVCQILESLRCCLFWQAIKLRFSRQEVQAVSVWLGVGSTRDEHLPACLAVHELK
jgi:hypothetical protein